MIKVVKEIDGKIRLKDISNLINIEDIKVYDVCDAWYNSHHINIDDIKRGYLFSSKSNILYLVVTIKKIVKYLICRRRGHNIFCKACGYLSEPGEIKFVDKNNINNSFCLSCIEKIFNKEERKEKI